MGISMGGKVKVVGELPNDCKEQGSHSQDNQWKLVLVQNKKGILTGR